MSLYSELQRRNVFRVAVLYLVTSWVILQIADVLFDQLGIPDWVFRFVLIVLVLGFPISLIFSWVYELTPDGLRRERSIDGDKSITQATGRKLNITIIVLLVLAIGGMIADRLVPEPQPTDQSVADEAEAAELPAPRVSGMQPPARSIAVLPFVNMSGDPENEYFSDGLTEELLNSLTRIRDLKMTGRTSSFAFKGQNMDLREVGKKLNVANILEGSVRKAQNRIRITAQLIKVADGYHLWSETYDRELDDIFAIQEEISSKVSTALSATLLGHESAARQTDSTPAYEAYLHGRYSLNRGPDDIKNREQARTFFQHAVELDPEFALGYYGLFTVLAWEHRTGATEFRDGARRLQASADQLLALAPGLAESHMAAARVALLNFDLKTSLRRYKEVERLSPNDLEVQIDLALMLGVQDELDQAIAVLDAVLERDPLSLTALGRLSEISARQGDCERLQRIYQRIERLDSGHGRYRWWQGYCAYTHGSDAQTAFNFFQQESVEYARLTGSAIALHALGRRDEAQAALEQLMKTNGDAASFQYVEVYAQWGDIDEAIRWLEYAREILDPGFILINTDKLLDPIRGNPRFVAMQQTFNAGM